MSDSFRDDLDAYLDGELSETRFVDLQRRLAESPERAREFAVAARLHDALRHSSLALSSADDAASGPAISKPVASATDRRRSAWKTFAFATLAASLVLTLVLVWPGVGSRSADASVAELRRVLDANREGLDRTYRLAVEESAPEGRRGRRRPTTDEPRPPKPPLDDASLYVARGGRFVLVRRTPEGAPFVTGSDGTTSWAVSPRGPVRTSADLGRFNRDLPGHEHQLPLASLHEGFERLTRAYELQLLPLETSDEDATAEEVTAEEATRLLVAVRRRGERGPRRVEISYDARSGLIRELRFVDMPYGPERLTVRMTLVDASPIDPAFFHHEAHHAADRAVENE